MNKITFLVAIAMLVLSIGAHAQDNTPGVTVSLLNQDPDPAIAGDIVQARIGVQNVGGADSANLDVEVLSSYPFSLVPGEDGVQNAGVVQAGQGYYNPSNMKILKYDIRVDREAPAGTYNLKVRYFTHGGTDYVEQTLPLEIKAKQNAEIIHIDKTTLVPGQLSDLRFSINNVGNSPLKDLTFYWENTDKVLLPVGSDNTRYIKYLDPNQSAEIDYQVIPDTNAAAGLYQLNLHLSYASSNSTPTQINTVAGVYIGGGTDFDVSYSETSGGQLSFNIANVGSNPASSVSVSIPNQRGWIVSGSNSAIIGNLNKGDYTVASFSLQSMANATGMRGFRNATGQGNFTNANQLTVEIAYTDTMGNRQTVAKAVNMQFAGTASATGYGNFQRRNQTSNNYTWYVVGAIVLIGAVVGYSLYKKRKVARVSGRR